MVSGRACTNEAAQCTRSGNIAIDFDGYFIVTIEAGEVAIRGDHILENI